MAVVYNYPTSLSRITRNNNKLQPSKTPLYFIYRAVNTVIDGNGQTDSYRTLRFTLVVSFNNVYLDLEFDFNGVTYKNASTITGRNQFLKTTNFTDFKNSIVNMFSLNGVLEEYDLEYMDAGFVNSGTYRYFNFHLKSKVMGGKIGFTTTLLLNPQTPLTNTTFLYNKNVLIPQFNTTITTVSILTYTVIGDDVSQDVDRYEIGLDIYKYDTEIVNNASRRKLTSVSKKGMSLADFDLSSIFDNDLEDWKPSITDFSINNNKWIEKYEIRPWQKYLDVSVVPTNTFVNIFYDPSQYDQVYIIDSYNPLFEGYTPPNEFFGNQQIQPNLESQNDGSYGSNNLNVYDKNLTNQPNYKSLNKSFEILCNQVYNTQQLTGSVLSDKVYFEFFFNSSTTSEVVILNNSNLQTNKSLRYINQLCFNVKELKNKIVGDFNDVYQIDVHFYNPVYRSNIPVTYETQSYYIDGTQQLCDDDVFEDIDYTPIVFKNAKGGFDLFEFESIQEIKGNRSYDSFTSPYTFRNTETSDFEKIIDVNYQKVYSIKSRILSDEEFIWLEEILKSKKVYILNLDNKLLYPIIIRDVDYSYKINTDKQISFSFNYSRPDITA